MNSSDTKKVTKLYKKLTESSGSNGVDPMIMQYEIAAASIGEEAKIVLMSMIDQFNKAISSGAYGDGFEVAYSNSIDHLHNLKLNSATLGKATLRKYEKLYTESFASLNHFDKNSTQYKAYERLLTTMDLNKFCESGCSRAECTLKHFNLIHSYLGDIDGNLYGALLINSTDVTKQEIAFPPLIGAMLFNHAVINRSFIPLERKIDDKDLVGAKFMNHGLVSPKYIRAIYIGGKFNIYGNVELEIDDAEMANFAKSPHYEILRKLETVDSKPAEYTCLYFAMLGETVKFMFARLDKIGDKYTVFIDEYGPKFAAAGAATFATAKPATGKYYAILPDGWILTPST